MWHAGLLEKVKQAGIQDRLLTWFKSYLTERRQRVVVDGQESPWLNVPAGVPQGSVLGPLMFLVYINDITTVVQTSIRLFADDTILHVYVDNPDATARALNNDLASMAAWADLWLVKFSPAKTVTLNISKKKKKLSKPDLIMNNIKLKEVESHKHLGVTLANDLTWGEHITNIAISANKQLDVFNVFKYKLDRCSLEKLYFAYVSSKLEYASIIWDNCPKYLANLLENVQLRAAKIISGATNRTSGALIYEELGWDSLQERRKCQRLSTMYKITHDQTPAYLRGPLPVTHDPVYNLRNTQDIPGVRARTSAYQNSFFPQTIREWNALHPDIQQAPSLSSFKTKIKDTKHKPPDWYGCGERRWSLYHARMRMFCSSLNDHLFSQLHVIDDPSCQCGSSRETVKHYLLECPLFVIERAEMLHSLQGINFTPSTRNLLHGSEEYDKDVNFKAFNAIHKFIRDSRRFG